MSVAKNDEQKNIRKANSLHDCSLRYTRADSRTNTPGRSSARFGALSHHSFFSRHNPHPQRVTHMKGLNGDPVCMVNDDWYVSSPLWPHPLISSQVAASRSYHPPPGTLSPSHPLAPLLHGPKATAGGAALLSDAWKEELKDIAAKVSMSNESKKEKREVGPGQTAASYHGRRTQYSAQTGRIVPPPTRSLGRFGTQASLRRRGPQCQATTLQPLHDQELMVLELLCQILQTDSLHMLQQWLLFAGQKEKDQVMGLLQQAMAGSSLSEQPDHMTIGGQVGYSRAGSGSPGSVESALSLPPRCMLLDRQPSQQRTRPR
ncbi:protein TBATA [Engraulis encrasicolus]|uniref:protein TBATA n=1 Tax=Engraulis encrasicolus TaxID=184585 RepID=UPI002FD50EFB